MARTYSVKGMKCGGCAKSVEAAIKEAAPEVSVQVNVEAGKVTIDGPADDAVIAQAVDDAGFTYEGVAA